MHGTRIEKEVEICATNITNETKCMNTNVKKCIPCGCGRSYTGETGRPVAVRLREHRHNLQQGLLEKSKLAQRAYEEGHRVSCDEARILEIESNSRYRKYKESSHVTCLTNPISQPSLDISPIWIPLISSEGANSQRRAA
jgi:Na+-translocating ferredoxin:NAD+ oxidoreductase RnfC subunit